MIRLYFLSLSVLLSSCKKDQFSAPIAEKEMDIVLYNPSPLQIFNNGQVVQISGSIYANFSMHGYSVRLTRNIDQEPLLEDFQHLHGTNLDIELEWTNTLSETDTVLIEIRAVGNHEGTQDLFLNRKIICLGE